MAEAQAEEKSTSESPRLMYPLDLAEAQNIDKEYIHFTIKNREALEEKKHIMLYTPPGIAVPDGATYQQVELGTMGGTIEKLSQAVDDDKPEVKLSDLKGLATLAAANKIGAVGQAALISGGVAKNPYVNVAFQGTVLRSFNFTFKLVAESAKEMEQIRQIENTFRKFLYPKLGESSFLLEYPPYWQIRFMKGASENKFMPFIHLCYLQSMNSTYNATANSFHPDGGPVEIDVSLTFQESKGLTRGDLYDDVDGYDNTEYHYTRNSPLNIPSSAGGSEG